MASIGPMERPRQGEGRDADMLKRGDRDHVMVRAISQDIGRFRQKIRADLERRREGRWLRRGASNGRRPSLSGPGGRAS